MESTTVVWFPVSNQQIARLKTTTQRITSHISFKNVHSSSLKYLQLVTQFFLLFKSKILIFLPEGLYIMIIFQSFIVILNLLVCVYFYWNIMAAPLWHFMISFFYRNYCLHAKTTLAPYLNSPISYMHIMYWFYMLCEYLIKWM
jgi:hypothetical protein